MDYFKDQAEMLRRQVAGEVGGGVSDAFWNMTDREKHRHIFSGKATPDEKLIHTNGAALSPELFEYARKLAADHLAEVRDRQHTERFDGLG